MAKKDNNADKRESRLLSEEIRDLSRENYNIVKDTYDIHRDLTKCLFEQNEALGLQKSLSQDINNVVKNSVSQGNDLTKTLKEQVKQSEKLRDNFNGIGDGMFDVLQVMSKELGGKKFSSFFGDAAGALKSAKKDAGGIPLTFSKGFKALGPVIKKSLGPLSIAIAAAQAIKFFVDAAFEASKQTAELSRNLLISRGFAQEMYTKTIPAIRDEYNQLNAAAGVHGKILKKDILAAQSAINKELGFQVNLLGDSNNLINQNVADAAGLVKHMGLSSKATNRLYLDSARTNQELDEMVKSIGLSLALRGEEAGLTADIRGILEETAGITGRLRANFGFSVESLAKAVFEAKLLGLSLSQVDKTSDSLLDFQSSIRAEMEAELLLGKELNLDKLRYYAAVGDTVNQSKELNKIVKGIGDLTKMNRFQQDAYAKSLGMSVDELADMQQQLKDQEKIAEHLNEIYKENRFFTKEDIENGRVSYRQMEQFYLAQGKSIEQVNDLLKDQIFQRMKTLDAQQRFNESLASAKEQFADFVKGGSLDKLAEGLERLVAGESRLGKWMGFKKVKSDLEITQDEIKSLSRESNPFNKVEAGYMKFEEERLDKIKALRIKEAELLKAEEDRIKAKEQREKDRAARYSYDSILPASTTSQTNNASGGNTTSTANTTTTTNNVSNDAKETNALLKTLIGEVKKGNTIYIDGKMVGQSIAQTQSKLG